eukprot:14165362-Alexandrium_andersonii.AAC.1
MRARLWAEPPRPLLRLAWLLQDFARSPVGSERACTLAGPLRLASFTRCGRRGMLSPGRTLLTRLDCARN